MQTRNRVEDNSVGKYWMVGAALAASLLSANANAAPVAASPPAKGRILILKPLVLTRVTDLDFGYVIPSAGGGTVKIDADTGARSTVGAGVTLVASRVGNVAQFAGAGSGGSFVGLSKSFPPFLVSPSGDKVQLVALVFDLNDQGFRVIDPVTLTFAVKVGGTIFVRPDQSDGVYSGTFNITATYF